MIAIKQFIEKGYQLVDPRKISRNIQIDALLYRPHREWVILEVKSLPFLECDRYFRVTKKQAK
ncbi:MAG: hypothetical protein KDD40_11490, partial [Bdellovibrionales bacterium]|nr:hypothetical protein [Bdellovibrionales bacterium]